uniref:phosphoenolpyruvate carboxylase n=1 Tax=Undibacterium sp. TaxID=1914977 RepID=UPI0037512DCB
MNDIADDKDQSLREDIRRLGRILGDTVRNQHGEEVFSLIETVRQNSIRFRRDADVAARAELENTLDTLTNDQTTHLIRAFSYFSHLVNLAEDQHHIRRTRAHLITGSAPRRGSLAHTIETLFASDNGAENLSTFFQTAEVSPVLTAHPTEVQRKSILNCQMVITRLLDE